MDDKTIMYTVNNYDPLNQSIDEAIKLQKARTAWEYAKVFALGMLALGLSMILLAWAYNIFKKQNSEIVRKLGEVDKIVNQKSKLDKNEDSIINGEVIKYNSKTHRFLSVDVDNGYQVSTRLVYSTTKDLLEGNQPSLIQCYISKKSTIYEYDIAANPPEALQNIGLSYNEAIKYKKYCKYNAN